VQCGFCTPGLIVTTHDLLQRNPSPTDPEIREALAGNLCRCTGYEKILAAVRLAAGRVGEDRGRNEGLWTTGATSSGDGLPSRSGAPGPEGRDDARPGTEGAGG
jgi:hypothetical protein